MSKYSKYIWFRGKIVPFNEAKIHVLSHCIHYGTGVFEGIKCYKTPNGPAIFRLREHMERLHKSGQAYQMEIPNSIDELCNGAVDIIKSKNLEATSFEDWEKIDSYEKKKAKEPAPRKKILSIKEMLNICKI